MNLIQEVLFFCDIVGTIAFAIAGTLVAIECDMDLSGAMILAFATSNGGGTIRDLILGCPVFWATYTAFILLPLISSMSIFFFYYFFSQPNQSKLFKNIFNTTDTIGLIAFTIAGTAKALDFHQMWIVAVMMGALSAVGGIIRDVLARRIPVVFQGQLYITST